MDFIKYEVVDSIAIVTFSRPPINALNLQAYDEIRETFENISKDLSIKTAILTAEGKTFMAGNDVNDIANLENTDQGSYMKHLRACQESVYECRVPVIAALNGAAVGAGLGLAASCDIIIATKNVKVSIPEINVGLVGAGESLSRLVPHKIVRYLSLTGEMLSATELKHYGGVFEIVEEAQLVDRALEIARKITRHSPLAVQHWKPYLNNIELVNLIEGDSLLRSQILMMEGDTKEAARAFLEKRKPNFSN